jgi:hypothetical protein
LENRGGGGGGGRVVMSSWTGCLSEARAVQISVRFAEVFLPPSRPSDG